MRLICFWCVLVAGAAHAQQGGFYAPQTFQNNDRIMFTPVLRPWTSLSTLPNRYFTKDRAIIRGRRLAQVNAGLFRPMHRPWNSLMPLPNRLDAYSPKGLFTPASRNDVTPQSSIAASWQPSAPAPVHEPWREPVSYGGGGGTAASPLPKPEPWRLPNTNYQVTKEQQAAILHHKQALTSEGGFRYEYASDNGLAAGEVIEPDGSRVGAYQYKDPSGQLVKLKYRAGKDGFQILEESHLPKSPEPVAPARQEQHYQQAYAEQRRQFELQQQYNQQRPEQQQQTWRDQGSEGRDGRPAGGQYFVQNWRPGQEDDGQYRENEVEQNRGPHTFGEGYAFSFQG